MVNFAAESHVDRSIDGPEPFVQTSVLGTLRLLEASEISCRLALASRRIPFPAVSTDEVYGSLGLEDPAFCETTPLLRIVLIRPPRQGPIISFGLIFIPMAFPF